MKSTFLKHDKRHSNKWTCNDNAKFIDCVLEHSFSGKNIFAYIYIFITYLAVAWQARLLDWHLSLLKKMPSNIL